VVFSSRRRHTSFSRDWSSDVCSSDLELARATCLPMARGSDRPQGYKSPRVPPTTRTAANSPVRQTPQYSRDGRAESSLSLPQTRSEERRVGKVCKISQNIYELR